MFRPIKKRRVAAANQELGLVIATTYRALLHTAQRRDRLPSKWLVGKVLLARDDIDWLSRPFDEPTEFANGKWATIEDCARELLAQPAFIELTDAVSKWHGVIPQYEKESLCIILVAAAES